MVPEVVRCQTMLSTDSVGVVTAVVRVYTRVDFIACVGGMGSMVV
jgi:hypothetical protein